LTVSATATCATGTESITVTAPSTGDQTYTVSATQLDLTIAEFTENSALCDHSNIVYSYTITNAASLSTTWITFNVDNAVRQLSVVTTNGALAGTYTVVVTGTITNANGPVSATTTFDIVVLVTCVESMDTIVITASTETDRTYTVGDAQ